MLLISTEGVTVKILNSENSTEKRAYSVNQKTLEYEDDFKTQSFTLDCPMCMRHRYCGKQTHFT